MSKVKLSASGTLTLPVDFRQRRHIDSSAEYWLGERDGELILRPCAPDVRKIYIEPTTHCNLNCRTCVRNIWGDQLDNMSMETFHHLVQSLGGLPQLEAVTFAGFGEPLFHPQVLEMIEAVRQRNLDVNISSSGLLLNEQMARELVKLGVERITISIDGVKPETYAGVRGVMLMQVLDNIHRLNDIKRELGMVKPLVSIEFVALKSNQAEVADLAELAVQLNATHVLVSNVLAYTEDMRDEMLYGYESQPPFPPAGWPVKTGDWIMWGSLDLPRMYWTAERRCKFVHDQAVVVGWDGGVSPCYALCHNYDYFALDGKNKHVTRYILGNVNEQPLADIWMSEEYVRFRSDVRAFHFPSCPDCDLRDSCDLREVNEGCWGLNPSCADCLWAQDIVRCP
jgi:tungsten cofactor oxidoreducase radical SAM maturase